MNNVKAVIFVLCAGLVIPALCLPGAAQGTKPAASAIPAGAEVNLMGKNGAIYIIGDSGRIHLVLLKRRVCLIGENGKQVGYIGENGLVSVAKFTKPFELFDKNKNQVGTIGKSGTVTIIGDMGRVALVSTVGVEIGHLGADGRMFWEAK
jgi:hypothetical protein